MFVNKIIIQEEKTKEQANTSDDRINDELGAIVKQVGNCFLFVFLLLLLFIHGKHFFSLDAIFMYI